MGSNNSRRRRSREMSDQEADVTDDEMDSSERFSLDGEPDLPAILAYLIRSGQVRVSSGSSNPFDDDSPMEDCYYEPVDLSEADKNQDTSKINENDIKEQINFDSGRHGKLNLCSKPTVCHMISQREIGMNGRCCFSRGDCCVMRTPYLPNTMENLTDYRRKAFCGTYSADGNIFLTACQDQHIRIYNTERNKFQNIKIIRARNVGWSILDTAFSPDGNYLIYSSWSEDINLCNIYGDEDTHITLPLVPGDYSFCVFSLTFSSDNQEILGGANDGYLYVYDRERNERTWKIKAHDDDVNAVAFADESSHILFSGGDDGLCKVWDRRTLSEGNAIPVGTFGGHSDGVTFIDSKNDARYLISNSKDQTVKLWDVRSFSSKEGINSTKEAVSRQRWDYRWQQIPRNRLRKKTVLKGDSSVMTYRGHSVLNTLIRCRFSPRFSTGQRYIYTGDAFGSVIVYDVLTGKVVARLRGHSACVRDVSWHPFDNIIMSTSWDGTVGQWTYTNYDSDDNTVISSSDENDDDDFDFPVRRSKRLKQKRKQKRKEDLKAERSSYARGLFD